MKKAEAIYESGDHKWIAITRDPEKPNAIIDTNEYAIVKGDRLALLDPGGMEVFPAVYSALGSLYEMDQIEFLFSSHQDPDIISSLPLWVTLNSKVKCYVSWVWSGFIPHFGCEENTLISIPDEGMSVTLNESLKLEFVPAHYLHSSGNFNVYDPEARILFSGDIGAALLPDGAKAGLFVDNFDSHIAFMKGFHQRWMPSNDAKNAWVDRIAKMDVDMICPQHGAIFKGENVLRFLQWFRDLRVGSAVDAIMKHS